MRRPSLPRVASLFVILTAAALASCAPAPSVPAPVVTPQPPPPAPPPTPTPAKPPTQAGPAKVALLVPLSGEDAPLGRALLDAAQLALFESNGSAISLVPRDTAGTAAGAAGAARSAIADGARLILGPLLAPDVAAVKPVAQAAHVNMIAFSTVTSLAGGNTFLMGFLPREEILREIRYARERGLDRFAALVPSSSYGHLVADALREAVTSSGATVTRVVFYPPNGSAAAAVAQLTGNEAPLLSPVRTQSSPSRFDALLLPEGGPMLARLAARLKSAGLVRPKVQLLGSGLWDTPGIGKVPGLAGGWFAISPPHLRQGFDQRFQATYGHQPPRLASLGFDAAALAAVLAGSEGGAPFSRDAILNPSGFTGIDGLFRFTADGLVQRGLAVVEVEPGGNVVVSPAPQSFQNLGY